MLDIKALKKSWPDFMLDVPLLSLGSGQIGAVLGPSGCGKSTLLRLIAGLEDPDSGSIALDGRELLGLQPEKRRIGLVFQDFALFPRMKVRANIAYGLRAHHLGRAETEARVGRLAADFGLEGLLDREPNSLSGGEQQRVALARALAYKPDFLLLDEPLSSLDAGLRVRLREEIADRIREAGIGALFVTHDVAEAFAIADQVFVMKAGVIVESGTPRNLYERPRRAWTARFLGRGPMIAVQRIIKISGGGETAHTAFGDFFIPPEPDALLPSSNAGHSAVPLATEQGSLPDSIPEAPAALWLNFPVDAARPQSSEKASEGPQPGPRLGTELKAECRPAQRGPALSPNFFRATVEASYYLGRSLRLRLSPGKAGDQMDGRGISSAAESIEIELPPGPSPASGSELLLAVPPERCIVLY